MSEESIENIIKSDSSFAPTLVDHYSLPNINFNGHCIIKNYIFISKKEINLYISYRINRKLRNTNTDFTLSNCWFGSVKLTKNADSGKYKYNGYGIGFDSCCKLSFTGWNIERNAIVFGADMSSSVHVNNKGKCILILGEGPTQGLNHTLTAEAKHSINFTQLGKRFVLCLPYNGSKSFLFVNATKVCQFKAKDSEIKDYALCLGNVSKNFTVNNMNRIRKSCPIFFCWF